MVKGQDSSPSSGDPVVSAVEQVLSRAARFASPVPIGVGKAIAVRAVWFCACVTLDEAPTWLIYDTPDGEVGWRRVPDSTDVAELVSAEVITGGHVDPADVLHWLQDDGNAAVPGDESADRVVVQALGLKVRELLKD